MRKLQLIALLAVAALLLGSCLKKMEIDWAPDVTINGESDGDEILYFSEISAATFDVKIESSEELKRFELKTHPSCSWRDSVYYYDPFTHKAEHEFSFKMSAGHKIISNDSLYYVYFQAYTADTVVTVKRTLRYKYIYPKIDSFDVEVGGGVTDLCLINVDRREAYPYTYYINNPYDLVFINELRSSYDAPGACITSPDAPINRAYFAKFCPQLPYTDTLGHVHKNTILGYVDNDHTVIEDGEYKFLTWADFDDAMLGKDDNWQSPSYVNFRETWGIGLSNLSQDKLYKFRTQNRKLGMIRVLQFENLGYPNCKAYLRIYYQK